MEKFIHLLIPKESNNHKAKLLHSSSLIIIVSFFILFQGLIGYVEKIKPDILGYAANISIQDVVNLTNQKRQEAGLASLSLNQDLSAAAYTKGRDMIDKDYWAHVAPDGTQPWKFFNDFGYKYKYAGENLARDFTSANATVDGWMNSPTHKDNILSPKYNEIGIGIVEGDLAGSDTTIVVQFFGSKFTDKIVEPLAAVKVTNEPKVSVAPKATKVPTVTEVPVAPSVPKETDVPEVSNVPKVTSEVKSQEVLISPFTTTRNASLIVISLLLLVFIVDAYLVSKRKITRIAGRTLAHVTFLAMILALVLLIKSGKLI